MTTNGTNQTAPSWIRPVNTLSAIEVAQLADGYPLLPINNDLAFDILRWLEAEPWKSNPVQPLAGTKRRMLREDILGRGMDRKPVLELSTGWVADGNTRMQIYNDCRRDGQELVFPGFELRTFEHDDGRADYQVGCALVQKHLSTKERKQLLRAGIRRHPNWTDNRLGALHGITQDTVSRISDEMVAAEEIPPRPERRIGADGREHDAVRLRTKKVVEAPSAHPAEALVAVWHRERGGHGTTAEDLLALSEANGIDLKALAGVGPEASGRARRLAVTAWLWRLCGQRIAGLVPVGTRAASGWSSFHLARPGDLRGWLIREQNESQSEDETASADT